ncbi:very short patch repair endonuclease [Marinobacter sp. LN3S78]|uniref:very short patch repair endonuclease n=1 Tax=Marinobacter sp. LN3S78 TaxID=3382300 RepID=UPI00387A8517
MDIFSPEKRSSVMSRVQGKNTKPELAVRRFLHRRGLRYRLHRKDLPGKPDIVFPSRRVVVFVHGCFWHQHPRCRKAKLPASHTDFWSKKLSSNTLRDLKVEDALRDSGWRPIVVWECEITEENLEALYQEILEVE